MTNERVDLLRLAADDCEAEANNQLREAPNLGPTKEQRNRMDAANIMKRVAALRLWADEMERSVEPTRERVCPDSADGQHVLKQDGPFSIVYCDACGMNRGWRTQEPPVPRMMIGMDLASPDGDSTVYKCEHGISDTPCVTCFALNRGG